MCIKSSCQFVQEQFMQLKSECDSIKAHLSQKQEGILKSQQQTQESIDVLMNHLKKHREHLESEWQQWEQEKIKINQLQPVSEIVKLSVSGVPLDVRKSTLCQVKGSSLEALFSGRHPLQTDSDGRIFVDRNFKNFSAVIDFI